MDALAPATIVVAMEQLDSEVAVLNERRHLLQRLLATFDDDDGLTAAEHDMPLPADDVEPERDSGDHDVQPAKAAQPARKNAKHDWPAIGAIAKRAQDTGLPLARTLANELGVNMATATWMVKRCRELGHIASSRERFTTEPIAREPFDPERVRAEMAGPATGPVVGFGGQPGRRTDLAPKPPKPVAAPRFSPADALAVLEAS